jgi:hypothetical protein
VRFRRPIHAWLPVFFTKKAVPAKAFSIPAPLQGYKRDIDPENYKEKMPMNVNREYKNSLFTALFDNEAKVRELYAALKGVPCDPALPVIITTLRDIIYMNQINDLSFIVGSVMVFIIEHQSSLNRNMPLRILLYMAEVYKKIVDLFNNPVGYFASPAKCFAFCCFSAEVV